MPATAIREAHTAIAATARVGAAGHGRSGRSGLTWTLLVLGHSSRAGGPGVVLDLAEQLVQGGRVPFAQRGKCAHDPALVVACHLPKQAASLGRQSNATRAAIV